MRLVLDSSSPGPAAPWLEPEGPVPEPGPGEVVVQMERGGLNRIDLMLCEGRVPRPSGRHVLGAQGSGRVVTLGAGVGDLSPGDLVALFPYGGCGRCERCGEGNETLCRDARLDGVNAPGMFTRHFVAEAADAFVVPTQVGAAMAAVASALAVAWHVLFCRGGLRAGETVAIASITSGLGACCGALAALHGAEVVGLARQASLERLRIHPPWLARVWATDAPPMGAVPPRVDLGVDAVGAPTLPIVHRLIRTHGRVVTVGAHAGGRPDLDLWRLFTREQDLRGSHGCHRADMACAVDVLARLREADVVDGTYPLTDHRAAYAQLDTPGRFGNVLLDLTTGVRDRQ